MIRGIEGRRIFSSDDDRLDFLKRLDALVPELDFRCFGWVLMPNHVHLAVRSGPIRLSRLMARLNTGYARTFNLRHRRQGFLFQNRFRSRVVSSEADLLAVIAYICRNPLEAGMVRSIPELSRWPWSGLSALTGARRAWPFESVGATLAMFGDTPEMARRNSVSRARAVIAYLAVVECRIPGRRVAKALGVSPSAVSHSLERGRIAVTENRLGLP